MSINFSEPEAVALVYVLVWVVLFPVAWLFKMSLFRFIYLFIGTFLLATALLSTYDSTFCNNCGVVTWPILGSLLWMLSHWATRMFVIAGALYFLWAAFKKLPEKKSAKYT